METLTDKRLAKIKAKREQANAEPEKKTKKTSKKSTAQAETSKEV